MADVAKLQKLRPCGRLETFSTARHHLGFHKNVGLTAAYICSTTVPASLETLVFQALREVITRHPTLSAIPMNEDKSYPDVSFVRLPVIDLRTCVEFHERRTPWPEDGEADEELDALLAVQHNRGFKDALGTKPFWRFVVVASATKPDKITASWFFHHALADGVSAFLFHETFLAALNSSAAGVDANPIVKPPSTVLLPPLEDLHPMSISWSFFLQTLSGVILPSIFAKRPAKLWTGNPVPENVTSIATLEPGYRTLVLSADTTRKLAQISRKEKTSVTATLQCLLAASLFTILPAAEYDQVKIEGPISIRRFLNGVTEDQMVNATTHYGYFHQRDSQSSSTTEVEALRHFSWDSARAVKSVIQTEVAKEGRDNPAALLKYVSDMPAFFTAALGKPRYPTAELSNIGLYKCRTEDGGRWKIGRMTFSQCPFASCAFAASVVTGGDGNATVNFCWVKGAVEEGLVSSVVDGMREGVKGLVERLEI